MHESRLANLLGACGLAVTDLTLRNVTTRLSASGAAAVVVLASGPVSGTELGRRVGLTQSAATRMVDTLVDAGLAERSARAGRVVLVGLTPAGHRMCRLCDRSACTSGGTCPVGQAARG